ncbi:lipocalin family protein, partial [Vibrio fluvialis]|nr:lipocalin family protein [Vibrio fluvialis]
DYSLALVSGYNTDYLWLLSRTPTIADSELQAAIKKVQAAGFDTSKLIFPLQKAK